MATTSLRPTSTRPRNSEATGRALWRQRWTLAVVVRRLPVWVLVTLILIVVLYPQIWVILGSFKTQPEFLSGSTMSLPQTLSFDNYVDALTRGNVAVNYRNSLLVTLPSVGLIVALGTAAGYSLEVMRWRRRNQTLLFILAGIMVPPQMLLMPLFTFYFQTGLTGTLWPLIITYTSMGLPLTIFLMAVYFRAVPREMMEAATMDGAGPLRIFFAIGVPMVKNAMLTVGLVQFFSVWNDLLFALTFATRRELETIQVGLLNFSDQYGSTDYGPLFAAISINIVALLIVFVFLNKKIMAGLAAGSVKG